jgi:predicted patatin/cPLA2 family phospholipase
MKKVAIVTSGGGMSCAYISGALLALAKEYGLVEPYAVIGGSGSAGALAYFTAGQYESRLDIWSELLTTKRFISLARPHKVMDINYLIDEVFKKQSPMDIEKIKKSKTKLLISATDFETGKPRYFSNTDDIYEALRASKAIPVIFNRTVTIDGRKYIDGQISSPLYNNIKKAKEEGAEKIIAIDTSNKIRSVKLLFKIYSFFVGKDLRKCFNKYLAKKKKNNITKDDYIMYIKPSIKLPTSLLNNTKESVKRTISVGYDDIANNKELRYFLEN